MSCGAVNDENHGVNLGGKRSSSIDDIFALEQPTGRPSILRQTENLPSKTVPKGGKVCFQTPRRDPVTKRIMSPSKSVKMAIVDECTKAMESLKLEKTNSLPQEVTKQTDASALEGAKYPDEEMPIQSKGGYHLDFDNLDALNPFQGSTQMVLSPPRPAAEQPPAVQKESHCEQAENLSEELANTDTALDETLPFTASVENSLADVSADIASTDSSVVTVAKVPDVDEQDSSLSKPEEQPETTCPSVHQDEEWASVGEEEKAPLPPRASYNFDFDNLDSVNPFQTGGSKIQNSPVGRKVASPPAEALEVSVANAHQAAVQAEVQAEEKPTAAVAPMSSDAAQLEDVQQAAAPAKAGPVKLEFNFDDGNEVKRKPPPKKLGKRPTGPKPKEGNAASDSKPPKEAAVKPVDPDMDVLPAAKGCYAFDFDDPNFNPFGSNAKMSNSPESSGKCPSAAHTPPPALPPSPPGTETSVPEHKEELSEEEASSAASVEEIALATQLNPPAVPEAEDAAAAHSEDAELQPQRERPVQSFPDHPFEQTTQANQPEFSEDNFVPATEFMSADFDGQMDYLEQFGSSSFKESALRKQSLYLKFDPLLRESPKKGPGPAPQAHGPLPAAFASRLDAAHMPEKQAANGPQRDDFPLFDIAAPNVPVTQNPLLLVSLVPPFCQSASTEEDIIEVLKYSQKDMDAAMAKAQAETKEKEEEWAVKYDKLSGEAELMWKQNNELERHLATNKADQDAVKEAAQVKVNKALLEKEQLSTELNSLERSFGDLLKRMEKYKDAIEGYKKNETTLKTCAQKYLDDIKEKNQRYQALRAHADEKLNHANAEIAEVRSRFRGEAAAFQAQLRREQMKVQSLEKSFDQKVKEAEELTKLCDELIANTQKV
ncbi:transforming acidic coiled-coil-containing protein 3 [Genypterus blacodes]|uniref:transforming acidic coiled-coil-containing protein 3 n=1 Tax=Genypterus blacodes TaxID=154954 RepID=UPI003F761605